MDVRIENIRLWERDEANELKGFARFPHLLACCGPSRSLSCLWLFVSTRFGSVATTNDNRRLQSDVRDPDNFSARPLKRVIELVCEPACDEYSASVWYT